jgi:hypothetical protein
VRGFHEILAEGRRKLCWGIRSRIKIRRSFCVQWSKKKRNMIGLGATSEMWCISRFGLGTNCVFHCNTDIMELPIKKNGREGTRQFLN